ncbi:circumsporozoite protein-like [Pteropus medius]|uniref:circumsporozoite protein-like n=1 Tax=Pteropus vampyrus TaxID=132908 RepID=UPI00196B040B|nr:circumsporozoite protein-like [Pteropus giganteus]
MDTAVQKADGRIDRDMRSFGGAGQHRARTGGRGGACARSHAPHWSAAGAELGGADGLAPPPARGGSAAAAEAVSAGVGGGAGAARVPPPLVRRGPLVLHAGSGTGAGAAGSRVRGAGPASTVLVPSPHGRHMRLQHDGRRVRPLQMEGAVVACKGFGQNPGVSDS